MHELEADMSYVLYGLSRKSVLAQNAYKMSLKYMIYKLYGH